MKDMIKRFWREEDGITALEYGILAAIILVAVSAFAVVVAKHFGDKGDITEAVNNAIAGTTSS